MLLGELNKDQLNGLANLCFDLAKGAFGLALLPTPFIIKEPINGILRMFLAIFVGIVFTYSAIILLKLKERSSS